MPSAHDWSPNAIAAYYQQFLFARWPGDSPDPIRDAAPLVWAFTELLVEEIASWGIYEVTRRRAEAVLKERAAAFEAGRPKTEYAIGSMEWMAQHPDWKPQED